jgi:hypothetical protein
MSLVGYHERPVGPFDDLPELLRQVMLDACDALAVQLQRDDTTR